MGFENFFFHKSATEKAPKANDVDDEEIIDTSKRKTLIGLGTFAAASVLPPAEVFGADLLPIDSIEAKKQNIEKIREYQTRLEEGRAILEDPQARLSQIMRIILPDGCSFDDEALKGTDLDHEEWFRSVCTDNSWPSVQLRYMEGRETPIPRFAHEPNTEKESITYGNSVFVDGSFISNRHMIERAFDCEIVSKDLDIAGCAIDDLSWNEAGRESIRRVELDSDRRQRNDDLHAQVVHVLGIHEDRGRESDNTDTTTGAVIKLNENIATKIGLDAFIKIDNPEAPGGEELIPMSERYRRSYLMILPSSETHLSAKAEDGLGLSGSVVMSDINAALGKNLPSGIVWAVGRMPVEIGGVKKYYTLVHLHGPDVFYEELDMLNTVVSMDLDKEEHPFKPQLTERVQMALHELGFYDLEIDGGYGEGTKQAVLDFQMSEFTAEELESKVIPGVVDVRTWEKLFPHEAGITKKKIYASVQK